MFLCGLLLMTRNYDFKDQACKHKQRREFKKTFCLGGGKTASGGDHKKFGDRFGFGSKTSKTHGYLFVAFSQTTIP